MYFEKILAVCDHILRCFEIVNPILSGAKEEREGHTHKGTERMTRCIVETVQQEQEQVICGLFWTDVEDCCGLDLSISSPPFLRRR